MSLPCQKACPGAVVAPSGAGRMKGWFYEGDEVACPKCGARYVVVFKFTGLFDAPHLVEQAA